MNGADKPSLRIGQRQILDRQLDALHTAGIDEVFVIGSKARLLPAGARAMADAVSAGPLGGIYSALLAATRPIVVVLAGDMPFVSPSLVVCLTQLGTAEASVPRISGRWHPLCASYRRRVAQRLKSRIDRGAWRVTDALSDLDVREVTEADLTAYDATPMQFINVNTPEDFREAEHLAATRQRRLCDAD